MFLDCLDENFLIQHVAEPTQFREGQASSLLDLVITDRAVTITRLNYEAPIGKSDHVCLDFEILTGIVKKDVQTRRQYFKGNYDEIRKSNYGK